MIAKTLREIAKNCDNSKKLQNTAGKKRITPKPDHAAAAHHVVGDALAVGPGGEDLRGAVAQRAARGAQHGVLQRGEARPLRGGAHVLRQPEVDHLDSGVGGGSGRSVT